MRTPVIILLFVILLAVSCGEPPMPPSDEEMIRHFTTHEVAFRKVYEIMAESSEGSENYLLNSLQGMGNGRFGICEPRYAVLLPRHRGCRNVQEFRLRSRIEKPSEYPYHRTWRPERDLPQDVQRHHAVQAHQGKLVHRVRPFDITARSPYQSMYHFLSRRYIIKQIMAIARKNNRTARSSLNLHLA